MTDFTKTRLNEGKAPEVETEASVPSEQPQRIGRYRIERSLGKGSFGVVYLGHDEQLDRLVAIKMPYRTLVSHAGDAETYRTEARTVANLDHPHIVPVYDVGGTENCPCFIVSKFIEGRTLAQKIKDERPSVNETVELVATIAEALHYAHTKGIVHRDIKPGNILIDRDGKPFVVDFGLALKEEEVGQGPRLAGTAAYMSPEQARGEGHRVDGRSDIFSLSIVFYELLTGRRPFKGDSKEEVREQIIDFEPRPPRQLHDAIPKEVERICLKALAKRASERYLTAKDMSEDLRLFLADQRVRSSPPSEGKSTNPSLPGAAQPVATSEKSALSLTALSSAATPTLGSEPVKIVPKGLRSFDVHDADFFLELLPGPRDRAGMPDSIRFWKTHIEERDPDNTFPVGLLYGPSGCGKSSWLKAGLLPRLSENVIALYVEATAEQTETRLLRGLRKHCPALSASWNLKETLAALRRGQGVAAGGKVLIVLDQFEQWLHARREEQGTELVQALRQCDGGRVQCLVLVRDDFWMAATRFMHALEIRLLEGQNSAAIDLFDTDHARKVLAAFGRAFGRLSENALTKEQKAFLRQAVEGLARQGKIICVRLALFAEMMKGEPWTAASLKAVGGAEGVGVAFLEETFSAVNAPPEHRMHQKAARAVLKALLPESGTNIKGNMRSSDELLQGSGYAGRPRDFEDLLRILDSEIRLITPTDPEGIEPANEQQQSAVDSQQGADAPRSHGKCYQLTHDYLVPSLRTWLTRKQKETRRGRAEILLADQSAVWSARPENRQLPTLAQWTSIRLLTRKKDWTEPQRKMMRKAGRYHAIRVMALAFLLAGLITAGLTIRHQAIEQSEAHYAAGLVQRLLDANISQVPEIVTEIEPYRVWADPLLWDTNARAAQESRHKLHTSLALLPVDSGQVPFLHERLLNASPQEVPVLRDALAPYKDELLDRLWATAEQPAPNKEAQRLRAACALAQFVPDSPRWAKVNDQVANDLVGVHAVHLALWMDSLRPIRDQLQAPLGGIYRDAQRQGIERSLATDILADYAANRPQALVDLLLDADDKQFAVLYPKLKDHREQGLTLLQGEIDKQLPPDAKEDAKEKLAKRQANAAVALLRLGQPARVWPLLKHSPDPRARSYLIHRLASLGADAKAIVQRLHEETDVTIRRALVMSLGQFGEKELAPGERAEVMVKLREVYRTDPDPGLHAAAEWLLRRWGQQAWLSQMQNEWAKDKLRRQRNLEGIRQELIEEKGAARPQWYVNSQGQTMVVLPGPVTFWMGSPPSEVGRRAEEQLHQRRIGRTFALAATSVTHEQFRRFRPKANLMDEVSSAAADCPWAGMYWYEAAEYCNWLSEQEGLPRSEWCYEPNNEGKYASGMKLASDYLKRTGYRLPSEAEWEYAMRAGALTSRYYGETKELLSEYAWYKRNSNDYSRPVGGRKPNDLGFFDGLGNACNFCQERYRSYPKADAGGIVEDKEDGSLVCLNPDLRIVRGSSYDYLPEKVRSAARSGLPGGQRVSDIGFRVARTFR